MPRLRNVNSRVIVSVSDATATRLDAEWVPVDASERSETPDKSWTVKNLKAYASENSIDLGKATSKPDIIAAITAANGSGDAGEDESDTSDDE